MLSIPLKKSFQSELCRSHAKAPLIRSRAQRVNNRRWGTALFEPVALSTFLLFFLFPLLDCLSVAVGFTLSNFIAWQTAQSAAMSSCYRVACANANDEAVKLSRTGVVRLFALKPSGGSTESGLELQVKATNVVTGATVTLAQNAALQQTIDQWGSVYQYSARVNYSMPPMIDLHFVPVIGSVPGLGKTLLLSSTVLVPCQRVDDLSVTVSPTVHSIVGACD